MDLRREFAAILDEFGHDVVVLHADRRLRCPACWSSTYREPESDCPVCLGTGYAYRVSRERTRGASLAMSPTSVSTSLSALIYQQVNGPAEARFDMEVFYFPHTVKIGVNDYILRGPWRGNYLADITEVYLVTRYERLRGVGGRVEFISAVARLRPEEVERFRRLAGRIREALARA